MPPVLYEQKDKIVTITLNRPEAMNSVDPETQEALIEAWSRFRDDDAAWVAILTGAGEKAFSLLVHLRQLAAKKLLIQTRMADNYCLKAIQKMDYDAFYREELKLRRQLHLPPSRHLVALGLRGKKEDAVFELAKQISDKLDELRPADIEVTDPHPDVNPKLRDKYRFTVVVKGKSVHSVLKLVKRALKDVKKRNVVITVNVDP